MIEIIDLLITLPYKCRALKLNISNYFNRPAKIRTRYFSDEEVMLKLNISKSTLKSLRTDCKIQYIKKHGQYLYKPVDVEKLINSNYYNPNFKCDGAK